MQKKKKKKKGKKKEKEKRKKEKRKERKKRIRVSITTSWDPGNKPIKNASTKLEGQSDRDCECEA